MTNSLTPNERVKKLRETLNMSQVEFCNVLGVKQGSLSDIERGKINVSPKMAGKISYGFGVSKDWIYTGLKPIFIEKKHIEKYSFDIQKDIHKLELESDQPFTVGLGDGTWIRHDEDNEYITVSPNYYSKEALAQRQVELTNHLRQEYNKLKNRKGSLNPFDDSLDKKNEEFEKLKDLYYKRLKRDLQKDDTQLVSLMTLLENLDVVIELLAEINATYLNAMPNPFDVLQYYDSSQHRYFIPETIEYSDYKENMLNYLTSLNDYKEAIQTFYSQTEAFFEKIEQLDTNRILGR